MRKAEAAIFLTLLVTASCKPPQQQNPGPEPQPGPVDGQIVIEKVPLQEGFKESFSNEESEIFEPAYRSTREDFRYYPGHPSLSARNTDILMLRIDPADAAGKDRGPNIMSRGYTHFGSYSARVRVPDIRKAQPEAGMLAGLSAHYEREDYGVCSIELEWRIANPEMVYLRALTGIPPKQNIICRTVNLAQGNVTGTSWREEITRTDGSTALASNGNFKDAQKKPESIAPIKGYDASSQFYTYGFDWYPDRITWWMQQPGTNAKVVLWDYEGAEVFSGQVHANGIPMFPVKCRFAFWHSKISSAEGHPSSLEAPKYPFELEVDWISYEPFEDIISAWQEEHCK